MRRKEKNCYGCPWRKNWICTKHNLDFKKIAESDDKLVPKGLFAHIKKISDLKTIGYGCFTQLEKYNAFPNAIDKSKERVLFT